jgi:hypothetical protein
MRLWEERKGRSEQGRNSSVGSSFLLAVSSGRLPMSGAGLSLYAEMNQASLRNILKSMVRGLCDSCFFTGRPSRSQRMMPF